MHLAIDGFGGNRERLADAHLVEALLHRYPERLGMTKIDAPRVRCYIPQDKPEDWGLTGIVVIAESHITIHTFPDKGIVWLDVFSCKPFEADCIITDVQQQFGLTKRKVHTLPRGLEYPS